MGMGEEMMLEALIDHDLWRDDQIDNIEAGIWTASDGEELEICKMKTPHIRNCVRMLEKGIENEVYEGDMREITELYLELFDEELDRRFPPQDPAFANG